MAAPMRGGSRVSRLQADDASMPKPPPRRGSGAKKAPGSKKKSGGPARATTYNSPARGRPSKKGGAAAPPDPPRPTTVRIDSPAPQRPAWQAYGKSILDETLDKMEQDAAAAASGAKPATIEDVMTIEDMMGADAMESWYEQMAKAQEDGKDLYPDEEGPPEPAEDGGAAPAKRPPGTKKRPTAKVKKSAAKKSAASRGSKRGARPKAGGGAAPRADAPQIEELDGGADDIEVDLTVHIQAVKKALAQLACPMPSDDALEKVVRKKVIECGGSLTFESFSGIIGFFKQLASAPQTAVINVTVPEGVKGGQSIIIQTTSGRRYTVKVPLTAEPGSTFQVEIQRPPDGTPGSPPLPPDYAGGTSDAGGGASPASEFYTVSFDVKQRFGLGFRKGSLVVEEVEKNSQAYMKGVQADSRIIEVNREKTDNPRELVRQIQEGKQRGELSIKFRTPLADRALRLEEEWTLLPDGQKKMLPLELDRPIGLGFAQKSMKVIHVDAGTQADKYGIKVGAEVMAVDGQRILTPEQFVKQIKGALDQQKNNITVTFKVEDESPKKKYDPSDAIYEVTFVHDEMMGITLSNLTGFPLPVVKDVDPNLSSPVSGDILLSIDDHKLYDDDSPFESALRLLKVLPRPLTLYFLPKGSEAPDDVKAGLARLKKLGA